MARGENPHPDGERDGGPVRQREILAQFETAIAGMRTREIQIGLRQLLAGSIPPPRTEGDPEADYSRPPRTEGDAGSGLLPPRPRTEGDPAADCSRPPCNSEPRPFGQDMLRGVHDGAPAGGDPALVAGREPGPLPPPVADLVRAVAAPCARRQMQRLVGDAQLGRWVQIETGAAAQVVLPYTWLLNRVGDDGIRLTEAGHLPPTEVSAALLDLNVTAPGHGRRENHVLPVRHLRESAQAMGLLRRQHGQLQLTAEGAELRSCPAALWWHLAERMPLRSAATPDVQPGLILLVCVAARCTDALDATIARMLSAIGWLNTDGSPLTRGEASQATAGTYAALRWLGALPDDPCPVPRPTPEGVTFTRAALRTWPSAG